METGLGSTLGVIKVIWLAGVPGNMFGCFSQRA
jgi:hypothetical protein